MSALLPWYTHSILDKYTLKKCDGIDAHIPCSNTLDCRSTERLPMDAFCKDGYCMCPKVDTDIQACSSINASLHETKISGPLLYRICKHDQHCNFLGGKCNNSNSQCVCSQNYVPSSNKQQCVPRITSFEASCTDKNQCIAFSGNATCENNTCVCLSGYHYVDNACWKTVEYNQQCTKTQECSHIEGSICTDNMTCRCAAETVLSTDGKRCLAAARKIQDECTESVQCTATFDFSTCVDKMCQCGQNFHYEHEMTRCFPNKAVGDDCVNNYECYQAEDYENDRPNKPMLCRFNKCTCADNYILNKNECVSTGSSFVASFAAIIILAMALTFFS
ncbi:PREDICTED: prion-like-(Q/N-rich) domain-bearing protein 25 isoform X2 [Vollenhovia emeryi]|uniref:prion-like-(Q/N-rich) domain-bearing protein 25 isoform X2 n=1 Tax=Vollenhovia emeryi TaxID=411798 RepID=UPI0005F3D619|nr:PREDICTED: prion-like-(Q/N-rich) domain-bearing protein 25 isoform X2 [Vollenhovia emeryi]